MQLQPLGDVVDEWGARRILALREGGAHLHDIASQLGTSFATVKRVLQVWRRDGVAREPKQGAGKKDDVRWIFAGPRGPANLYHLERIRSATDGGAELLEVHDRVVDEMDNAPAYSTMTRALDKQLDYSRKRVRR